MRFLVPAPVVRVTEDHLRAKGREQTEGVVLWVGTFQPPTITRAAVPEQVTNSGRFQVPLAARQQLARELSGTGQVVVAQVHTHPGPAFHSNVDDAEAIPRRVGAYSLVVPNFGSGSNLLHGAALFELHNDGSWRPAPLNTFHLSQTQSRLRWLVAKLKSFGRSLI